MNPPRVAARPLRRPATSFFDATGGAAVVGSTMIAGTWPDSSGSTSAEGIASGVGGFGFGVGPSSAPFFALFPSGCGLAGSRLDRTLLGGRLRKRLLPEEQDVDEQRHDGDDDEDDRQVVHRGAPL